MARETRRFVLSAVDSGRGEVLAKYGVLVLQVVATPSAWLRCTDTLLFFAIALMLERMLALARAKKVEEPAPTAGQGPESM